MEKNQKKETVTGIIISIGLTIILILGLLSINTDWPLETIVATVSLIMSYIIHIIIHEAGHLIGGLKSGYQYQSFRIFNTVFVKQDGKLVKKKFNIVGTAGQCLMSPPDMIDGTYPHKLYFATGGIVNIFTSLIVLLVFVFIDIRMLEIILWPFILVGFYFGLLNLIPLLISGVANDGYQIADLGKNEEARLSLWRTLRIHAMLSSGTRLRDMPAEWFELAPNFDNSNNAMTAFWRIDYLVDSHRFKEAKKLAEELAQSMDKLIGIQQRELKCELILLELIGDKNLAKIDELYNKKLQRYVLGSLTQLSKQRLLYAYSKLYKKDEKEAANYLKDFEETVKTYPILGDIEREREIVAIINQKAIKEQKKLEEEEPKPKKKAPSKKVVTKVTEPKKKPEKKETAKPKTKPKVKPKSKPKAQKN